MNTEQRETVRRVVRLGATIVGADNSVLAPCLMADVSPGGARLIVQSPAALPDRFALVLSRDGGLRRECAVAWRSNNALGVEFLRNPLANALTRKLPERSVGSAACANDANSPENSR
jgi:hypothetical protein